MVPKVLPELFQYVENSAPPEPERLPFGYSTAYTQSLEVMGSWMKDVSFSCETWP